MGLCYYAVPLLKKQPDKTVLHVSTNDAPCKTANEIIKDLMILNDFILDHLPSFNLICSTPALSKDNQKCSIIIKNL